MPVRAAKARAWEDDGDAAPGGNKTDALAPTGRKTKACPRRGDSWPTPPLVHHLPIFFRAFPMLRINDLVFDAYGRRFFDGATVALPVNAKVGLVGRNGAGKTTLFKLIKGELEPGGGEIGYPKAARIASVDQEHPASPVALL